MATYSTRRAKVKVTQVKHITVNTYSSQFNLDRSYSYKYNNVHIKLIHQQVKIKNKKDQIHKHRSYNNTKIRS